MMEKDMEDIELVIKIPKEEYEFCKKQSDADFLDILTIAVKYGTTLPKGHGRLGDLDALEAEIVNGIKAGNYEKSYETFAHINDMDDCVECVKYTDTIIEVDKADRSGE